MISIKIDVTKQREFLTKHPTLCLGEVAITLKNIPEPGIDQAVLTDAQEMLEAVRKDKARLANRVTELLKNTEPSFEAVLDCLSAISAEARADRHGDTCR